MFLFIYLFIPLLFLFTIDRLFGSNTLNKINLGLLSMQMEYLVGLKVLCAVVVFTLIFVVTQTVLHLLLHLLFIPFFVCHTRHLTHTIQIDCRISIRFFLRHKTRNCLHDQCIHPFSHCDGNNRKKKQFNFDGINKFNVHRYFGCMKTNPIGKSERFKCRFTLNLHVSFFLDLPNRDHLMANLKQQLNQYRMVSFVPVTHFLRNKNPLHEKT